MPESLRVLGAFLRDPDYAVAVMAASHKYQAPTGTRDFYPADLAVRRHLESIWRTVSTNHGFEEIDGPTFEHLELYTAKSGPGIVSELFSFRRAGGEKDYALRPEFTPTLARMVAARAAQLPKPIKWFCMPNFYRAERPQRGRLREFQQWNVDVIGDDSPRADAEVIATCVGALEKMGLTSEDVRIRISHRGVVSQVLRRGGVASEKLDEAFALLDKKSKIPAEDFERQAWAIGLTIETADIFERSARPVGFFIERALSILSPITDQDMAVFLGLFDALRSAGVDKWCDIDFSIVRGLAYYTGTVFEVHEASGRERAIAGGGRYDRLVELFGGPPTPAVGFAMGDVVIRLVLEDRGLLEPGEKYLPQPDVFIVAAKEEHDSVMRSLVAECRRAGLHARHSYKATRNIGKLLGEAGKARSRLAVIIGDELTQGQVVVKDLASGEQLLVPIDPSDLQSFIHMITARLLSA